MSSDSENDNSPALRRIGGFTEPSQDEMNIVDVCANRAIFDQVNNFSIKRQLSFKNILLTVNLYLFGFSAASVNQKSIIFKSNYSKFN